jgi:hypothetical protein
MGRQGCSKVPAGSTNGCQHCCRGRVPVGPAQVHGSVLGVLGVETWNMQVDPTYHQDNWGNLCVLHVCVQCVLCLWPCHACIPELHANTGQVLNCSSPAHILPDQGNTLCDDSLTAVQHTVQYLAEVTCNNSPAHMLLLGWCAVAFIKCGCAQKRIAQGTAGSEGTAEVRVCRLRHFQAISVQFAA